MTTIDLLALLAVLLAVVGVAIMAEGGGDV